MKSISQQLNLVASDYDIIDNPDITLVIGSCSPKDNILLKFADKASLPKWLSKMLSNERAQLKYILREKDILVDIVKFNQACVSAFNCFFGEFIGKKKLHIPTSIMFVAHKKLDCYSMLKVLKFIFGKKNCVSIHEQITSMKTSPIVATNDVIDRCVKDKTLANRDPEFKRIVKEVEQYVKQREKEMKVSF